MIPERLVTIRRYDSAEPAVEDCRLLIDAGLDAYIRTYRWADIGEVRVPEGQVQRALALLPAQAPDSLPRVDQRERCAWCGSEDARLVAPFTTVLACAGAALVGWEIYLRRFEAAAAAAFLALLIVAMTKMAAGHLVCVNCGRDWRPPQPALAPEDDERSENREE